MYTKALMYAHAIFILCILQAWTHHRIDDFVFMVTAGVLMLSLVCISKFRDKIEGSDDAE